MRNALIIFGVLAAVSASAMAADLYHVIVKSQHEADLVTEAGVETVFRLRDGYLVLAGNKAVDHLKADGVKIQFLESDISIDELAVESRSDAAREPGRQVLFTEDELCIVEIDASAPSPLARRTKADPMSDRGITIEYRRPKIFNNQAALGGIDLDSLISLVSRDSLEAYLYRLEAFGTRLTGTDSAYAAGYWIADKFASFGYDSIIIDPFTGSQLWPRVPVASFNVIATKVGTKYPNRQIIVGGHYDAVPDCPGADDDASGTAGVLEIARVLKDIETDMTFIFIAFDSEESWMWGSYHYADGAAARGDNIVYMQNIDMIGHITNSDRAHLHYGPEVAYSRLWLNLADSLVGIAALLAGSSASDHLPFQELGYDVTFVQEYDFSTHYHQPSDSTTYINFDYMTRMVQASLATDYTVCQAPPPVTLISVRDAGDGQSLLATWEPLDTAGVDHYVLQYGTDPVIPSEYVMLPKDSSRYMVTGLQEGVEYFFSVVAYYPGGVSSIAYDQLSGTPRSKPALPAALSARPLIGAVRLTWQRRIPELDFSHYQIIRDGLLLPQTVNDTVFVDGDVSLGKDLHHYLVVAVDSDGNISDTTGAVAAISKAATLEANRILAVNRSSSIRIAWVDESTTGQFMREALTGYDYDYFSDTAGANPVRAGLFDMIDYGLVVIGTEGARLDAIGGPPAFGGILADIGYYLSLGGKAIIFGRWGDVTVGDLRVDTFTYLPPSDDFAYNEYFHIGCRVEPMSFLDSVLRSDLIGAHPLTPEYPELVWDSAETVRHTDLATLGITGIPCASFVELTGADPEVIYSYNSSNDSILTEGKPIGWRYLGGTYEYVFFNMPLSFMERPPALAALHQAVVDLGIVMSASDDLPEPMLPARYALGQNFPNPFNPRTTIELSNLTARPAKVTLEVFNILGQRVATLFDGVAAPGRHRVEWDGCDQNHRPVVSGIYFYRMKAEGFTTTRKMVMIR